VSVELSVIDRALGAGDVVSVRGRVEHGDKRGRQLGFPTANLAIADDGLPDGVWAGWLERVDGVRLPAAISVGRRATVYLQGVRLLEAHVIGFGGDLYGEVVTVRLAHFLRDQRRFSGIDALVVQLRHDVAHAQHWCLTTEKEQT
jgi:FAD synthase